MERCLERVRRRRNDIEFDVHIAPWQVFGDAAGLSRAVLNLLDNAAKWSPPGGRCRCGCAGRPGARRTGGVRPGPGIPPGDRRLVFERFYRSDAARAMPGSGLGLAIVKQVVLKHGGALRVEDTVPGSQPPGTSIYVWLPGQPVYPVAPAGHTEIGGAADPEEKSSPKSSVISVDSQSMGAR